MSVAVKAQAKKQNCKKKEQSSRDIVLTKGIKVESRKTAPFRLMKTRTP